METMHLIDRQDAKQVPSSLDAKPITDYVSLKLDSDQRLSTLVHNLFHKVFMVKDY